MVSVLAGLALLLMLIFISMLDLPLNDTAAKSYQHSLEWETNAEIARQSHCYTIQGRY